MLIFRGGLKEDELLALANGDIYTEPKMDLMQMKNKILVGKNTFAYTDLHFDKLNEDVLMSMIEHCYDKQYIHFFKYLRNALTFCHNSSKRTGVIVLDVPSDMLTKSIGVGKYPHEGYKLEYRIPRYAINKEWVSDTFHFEPWVMDENICEKYRNQIGCKNEDDIARRVMKRLNRDCNYY